MKIPILNPSLLIAALAFARVGAATLDWRFEPAGGSPVRLLWKTETGRSYTLRSSGDLISWALLEGYPKAGTGGWIEQLFLPGKAGFFRIDSAQLSAEEFVLIPGVMFQMGDTFHEGRADEFPVYELYLPSYWIGRTEVTKGLWDEVRLWAGSHGYTDLPAGFAKGPDHPVGSVSWHAAVKWCNARSEREGLNPCYLTNGFVYRTGTFKKALSYLSNGGYRLPTEAEWERAARGGAKGRRFPWNDSDLITHERANYYSTNTLPYDVSVTAGFHPDFIQDPMPYTNPVGSLPANGLGLHDMAGNVFEWCGDWYDSYPSNQGGPASGDFRIYRGGAWGADASTARCAYREPLSPTLTSPSLGFRLARAQP